MELEIEKVRDKWIDKFKNKWDFHVQSLVIDKNSEINKIQNEHLKIINKLKEKKEKQIQEINAEYKKKLDIIQYEIELKKKAVIERHNKRITDFLKIKLKQPTFYDLLCSYMSYVKTILIKNPILYTSEIKIDDEPEIITFNDIHLSNPKTLYPIIKSCSNINDEKSNTDNDIYTSPYNDCLMSAPPSYSEQNM